MLKKILNTALFLTIGSSLVAGSYQNVVRSTEDRSKVVFQIKKSSGAVQFMKEVQLPLPTAYIATGTAAVINFSSTPGLEAEALQKSLVIDWGDGEVNDIAFSLRVPVDYHSGGQIVLEALSESNVTTTTKASIGGRVNGGTITRSDNEIDAGSFEDVEHDLGLTMVAGDDLTVLIVRNDSTSGTGTLQIKNVVFRYNESMDK